MRKLFFGDYMDFMDTQESPENEAAPDSSMRRYDEASGTLAISCANIG